MTICYRVELRDLNAHLYRVSCTLARPDPAGQVFAMPGWIRGSYLVRDFARHIVDVEAHGAEGPVPVERLDKRRLRCAPCRGTLTLRYRVYAFDLSVRKAWLDRNRGFFNGTALFYAPEGLRDRPCRLTLEKPRVALATEWRASTSMDPVAVGADGFGTYRAENYESLIDHPVEMGCHQTIAFKVDGISHALVLSGRCEVDAERLAQDLAAVCRAQRALFQGEPTGQQGLRRYRFLCNVRANGYGGLEHRASSALTCARDALPRLGDATLRRGYRSFLGLVSHEYFHLWNVKRITPRAFAQSDLGQEAYTQDLWAYEGVTSYYDDLMLRRSERIDAGSYLDLLAQTATRVERAPGHSVQSLADASFEAWIKYYQPDENTLNACASYYTKGALVSLCLDLTLRLHSNVCLDDVMRTLWSRYGRTGVPAPEGALEEVAAECSGLDLRTFFDRAVRSIEVLPMTELLAPFGVTAVLRTRRGAADVGGVAASADVGMRVDLGLQLRDVDGSIATVRSGSAAEAAGLAPGDRPVALDGLRVEASNWARHVEALAPGRCYRLHYFRDDQLGETDIEATPPQADTWTLTLCDTDTVAVGRRRAWIGA